jgi:hypothetical protein
VAISFSDIISLTELIGKLTTTDLFLCCVKIKVGNKICMAHTYSE